MYITYQEFCNINGFQPTFSTEQFAKYELKARMKLDYYTQKRINKLTEIPEKIKYLMVELILLIYSYEKDKADKGIVQSISNDGYSVTYQNNDFKEENEVLETKLHSLITDYATEYCYRGIEHG